MRIYQDSKIGNIRKINQDYIMSYQKSDQDMIFVLCDGMGGHNGGEVASLLTCQDIINSYSMHDSFKNEDEIKAWLYVAINHANAYLQFKGEEEQTLEGMGTTVVIALIINDDAYISHVGDSRAYYYHDELIQLTKDHTLVNALVDNGTISETEAMYHPKKNILIQAVGANDILQVSYYKQEFNRGLLLLCSDGLYNSLYDNQILEIFSSNKSFSNAAEQLMEEALRLGGSDNISFIMIDKGVFDYE